MSRTTKKAAAESIDDRLAEMAGKPLSADPSGHVELGQELWGVDFRGISARLTAISRDVGGIRCRDDHGGVVVWPLSRLFEKRPTNEQKAAAGLIQLVKKGGNNGRQ